MMRLAPPLPASASAGAPAPALGGRTCRPRGVAARAVHDLSRRSLLLTSTALAPALAARADPDADPGAVAAARFAADLERRVTQFRLPNGMAFIVLERGPAPVVSVVTHAAVGAYDEPAGLTGIAHLLEHMAFKGTTRLGGAGDPAMEAALLAAEDDAFYELRALKSTPATSRPALAAATARLDAAAAAAATSSTPNAYGSRLADAGAVGLNATTSHDATRYFCSLPSNALELWFALEADRFRDPVFRGLHSEKRVVAEERRSRVDGAPLGAFQQRFLRGALANNYGRPVIGLPDDVERVGRRELASFFGERYGPASLTVAVVGDAPPARVRTLAEKYFGSWEPGVPPPRRSVGSSAATARPAPPPPRLESAERGGPVVLQAYYRPASDAPDAAAVDAACEVLSGGRSSRLHAALVRAGLALAAGAAPALPGDLRPCAVLLQAVPAPGVAMERVDAALAGAARALAADGPTDAELARLKKAARAGLYGAVRSNAALASLLAGTASERGDWTALLADAAAVDALTAAGVESAAGAVFAADANCAAAWALPAAEVTGLGDAFIA